MIGGVPMAYTFPELLRTMRTRRGLSQKQLAEKLRVSQAAVSLWETGAKYPSLDRLYDLAAVLGCRVAQLVDDKEA